jgi:hypothetical protein
MNKAFTDVDVAALLRIAGGVGELAEDLHLRRRHILDGLLGLMGGCSAVCSEIDPQHAHGSGWAVPNSITCAGGLSRDQQAMIDRYLTGHLSALDPCIPPLLLRDESVVTLRRADAVDDSSWYHSDHFNEVRRPLGFGESIYAKLTTPDGRRLKLSFHRESNDPPFTRRHVELLYVFNANLARLYVGTASTAPAAASTAHHSPRRMTTLQHCRSVCVPCCADCSPATPKSRRHERSASARTRFTSTRRRCTEASA